MKPAEAVASVSNASKNRQGIIDVLEALNHVHKPIEQPEGVR